jgi:PleD family two-component response regulator
MPDHYILLLDPFKNLRSTFRLILEEERYLVEIATDTEEALHLLSHRHYSVFITEYVPPLEDTCRVIQWLKQNAPETFIVMVTQADLDETTYETLFDIGLDDFILKPYPAEKIIAHVKKGIRQRDFILEKQEVERQTVLDRVAQQVRQPIFSSPYFRRCLRQELKRARRHNHPLSLLLVEIPAQDKMGDRFEHFCIELAKIFRHNTREEDMVGRENVNFGILLPETDQPGSEAVAKRLSRLIQSHPSFQSDTALAPFLEAFAFQSFTYPETFALPESLMTVLEEVDSQRPRA